MTGGLMGGYSLGHFIDIRERQRARDNEPCPTCGGDRLRTDFTGGGRCHAARGRQDCYPPHYGQRFILGSDEHVPPATLLCTGAPTAGGAAMSAEGEDKGMAETESYYEYGYRIVAGDEVTDVWPQDYGPDGVWTPRMPDFNMGSIDFYGDDTEAKSEQRVRAAILEAGVDGIIIRRKVTITHDDVEEMAFVPAEEGHKSSEGEKK